jgi:hypothetical protein
MRFVDGAWVVTGVVDFECGGPCFMSLAETLIPGTSGFGLFGGTQERAQDVDGFELVGNHAAGGQLEFTFLELLESKSDLSVALSSPSKVCGFSRNARWFPM